MMSKISIGQIGELIMKDGRGELGNMSSEDLQWLLEKGNWKKIAALRNGTFKQKKSLVPPARRPQPSDAVATRYNFTVVEGEDIGPTTFSVATLKPCTFLRGREQSIKSVELHMRAVELKGNLSLADGQRIVDEQDRNPVPAEFEGYYIPLTGTLLRRSDGDLYFACLHFVGSRWCLDFCWLGYEWGGSDRLACSDE